MRNIARTLRSTLFIPVMGAICLGGLSTSSHADILAAREALKQDKAFEALQLALNDVDSQPVDAYTVRAEAYLAMDEVHLALGEYQRALSHSPGNAELLEAAGLVEYERGRLLAALSYLNSAFDLDPDNARIAEETMKLLVESGDAAAQREFAAKALETVQDAGTRADFEWQLGSLLSDVKKHKEALPYLERTAEREGATVENYALLASTLFKLKAYDKAIAASDKALALNPRRDDVILIKADSLLAQKKEEAAYEQYWQLEELESPLWGKLPQTTRLNTARYKDKLHTVVVQQYGVVLPLAIGAGILGFILLILIFVLLRSKDD